MYATKSDPSLNRAFAVLDEIMAAGEGIGALAGES
jgi:hypothetical protein